MEFYKEILRAGSDQQTNVIAVFPPKTEEAEIYLKQFGLDSLPVLFAPLEELEVDGTPTIILTDASGKVTNFWIGQLSKEKEREVLRSISS
ncbi:TlpA family protein disulfide reductase [Leptolyngbya sp. 7M]|uniref:TlpA family protein disulfide reductase n=1 Tax=Leptolyngbya sp. 7M TaxID=2812896 RepID=UPI001B8AEA5E|nr:hypothetical protein [Leptolyngbya sp. 7M]QYO65959.1 hypothetical protein JVX88_03935 [Leptolyngbya sp. 7M]